ncbi:MAG: PilZ domain-containing protein [Beijerinckiaceae bacterium]
MSEKRKELRSRTVLRASIIFNHRNSTLDCLVRNFADHGAKIILDPSIAIPQQFELNVPQKGRSFTAKVIWRHGEEIGVEFANEVVNSRVLPVGEDLAAQLRELERENAKLKKKCAELQAQVNRNMECA